MSQSDEMNQIINQVKSETRSENFRKFFSKNSKMLVTASAVVVIASISFFIFDSYKVSQENKFSAILQQSLIDQEADELEKAKSGLDKIINAGSAPKNLQALALLRQAGLDFDEGNIDQTIAAYEKVNQCKKCDAYIKDLGGLLMVKVWLSDEQEVQKDDLLSRIEKIENNSTDLKYHVTEQKAIFEMQQNNLEKSYVIFESLAKNPEVDSTLKKRANEALQIVISKGYKPVTT